MDVGESEDGVWRGSWPCGRAIHSIDRGETWIEDRPCSKSKDDRIAELETENSTLRQDIEAILSARDIRVVKDSDEIYISYINRGGCYVHGRGVNLHAALDAAGLLSNEKVTA
jgi:hypothetical protein